MKTKNTTHTPGLTVVERIAARRRLERAAPELLAACKSALYGANTKDRQGGILTAHDVDLLVAAIAKAEGQCK